MAVADDIGTRQWRRITATVKPIRKAKSPSLPREGLGWVLPDSEPPVGQYPPPAPPLEGRGAKSTKLAPVTIPPDLILARARPDTLPPPPTQGGGGELGRSSLDKAWERDLRSGKLSIDMVIDLHGHHLAGAHSALARALDRAVLQGARMLLVVAGKARGSDEAPRGAIRRELTTWLSHSPHAPRILAVRNAHPRHGGAGAVYVVLRKLAPAR